MRLNIYFRASLVMFLFAIAATGAFSEDFLKSFPRTLVGSDDKIDLSSLPSALVDAPSAPYAAVYSVSVRGVLVGTASAGQKDLSLPGPTSFELRILNRVGSSPIVSHLSFESQTKSGQINIKSTATVKGVIGDVVKTSLDKEMPSNEPLSLLFYKPNSMDESALKVFLPFSGETRSAKEILAKYDSDGFLASATVPWPGGMALEFKRVTLSEVAKLGPSLGKSLVDFSWFPEATNVADDFRKLRTVAENCIQYSRNLEAEVTRKIPEVPYLLHRKIFNYQRFCTRISTVAAGDLRPEAQEQTLENLARVAREIMSEDRREIPLSMVNNAEWEVLRDDSKKWQWVRLISYLITQTQSELSYTVSIEQKQKTPLQLRLVLDKLGRRSVVRGILKPRDLALKMSVETAANPVMKASSLVALSELQKKEFEFVNGQAFARGAFVDFGPICSQFDGKVGLDLGEAPQEIYRTEVVRGIWDKSTRLSLVREFARRAGATPGCRHIVVRAPKEYEAQVNEELGIFKREILQTETSFQFSNGSVRKMRLVPGVYDFVASSLVSGNVFGRQELVVASGKAMQYTVKFK